MSDQFEVLENAGLYNETEVETFPTYKEAKDYVKSNYTKEEQEQMGVDITCNGSTEY
ncbi:hypothetical protein OCT63_19820 [Vibrio sp. RW]|uniref:hypothetical protein n=1 Tax=Vibrio sp. RW TaxID=2998833 RepID=UPI0022CD4F14|nr:hypothetical protein [Vibrio sp. RW]MDA0146478.1 hypothetical protein [Vibrio sp. RW]